MRTLHFTLVAILVILLVLMLATRVGGQSLGELSSPPSLPHAISAPADELTPAEALAAIKQLGGVLVHYDDRLPGRPVTMLDLTGHPRCEDGWTRYFPALPELRQVGLSGTKITDAALEPLARCKKLDALFLAGTQITDAGLDKLAACRALQFVDLHQTAVTRVGVARLQHALPRLTVAVEQEKLIDVFTWSALAAAQSPAEKTLVSVDPTAAPIRTTSGTATFTAAAIRDWRTQLTEAGQLPEATPAGWSKSRVDPAKLVALLPALNVRPDYKLVAYVFLEEGNSNGFVWALPLDGAFPEPAACPRVESHFLHPPKPFDALDDVMEAIGGDDSPRAYLQASLLRRAFKEFGSGWHGVKWGMHSILDADPWQLPRPADDEPLPLAPRSAARAWKWLTARPARWQPTVRWDEQQVVVTFYSYTPLAGVLENGDIETERIYLHTDTYRRGKYRGLTVEAKIATGPDAVMQ